ncbi:hypothetical protein EXT57_14975 [Pectobacterium brasiliense]|nr:hypothetical protein [Pectobacterium brasiliense]
MPSDRQSVNPSHLCTLTTVKGSHFLMKCVNQTVNQILFYFPATPCHQRLVTIHQQNCEV